MSYRILGYGYAWWRGDPRPTLPPLAGFHAVVCHDYALVAALAQLSIDEVHQRVADDNQIYLAFVNEQPAAYGWSAVREGSIQELDLTFAIPARNRWLWDFVTLPEWRGRGIYPHLLQAIFDLEASDADRFWIGHTVDNQASRRGIEKAGFEEVETLVASSTRSLHVVATGQTGRAHVSPMGLRLGVIER